MKNTLNLSLVEGFVKRIVDTEAANFKFFLEVVYKLKINGIEEEEKSEVRVEVTGRTAEACKQYIAECMKVRVRGRLVKMDEYFAIKATSIEMLMRAK